MSQHARRVLAALGLMATLLLAAPLPSRAAGLRELPSVTGFAARAWAWLENLLPDRPAARGERQVFSTKTDGTLTSPTAPPPTGTSDEGSAIDPNGRK
jgi:hypothetical protein